MKKIGVILIIVAILICVCITLIHFIVSIMVPPNAKMAQKLLSSHEEHLEAVVQYFESTNINVYIDEDSDCDAISDPKAVEEIQWLLDHGYKSVSREGNTISFLRWTRWKDFGAGLAYVTDPAYYPSIDYLANLEQLSDEHWYYYEEN